MFEEEVLESDLLGPHLHEQGALCFAQVCAYLQDLLGRSRRVPVHGPALLSAAQLAFQRWWLVFVLICGVSGRGKPSIDSTEVRCGLPRKVLASSAPI
jgi:hypothetical protein